MNEDRLVGWLCMWRLQHGSANDGNIDMPSAVMQGLADRGWVEFGPEEHDGKIARITEAGAAITDLHGPDWGIDTIPVEAE